LHTVEPALAHSEHKLVGGLRTIDDETGDCQMFTTQLTEHAKKLGVDFRYNVNIQKLHSRGGILSGVQGDDQLFSADRDVLALGSYSTGMLSHILPLPVYPLKGYSITVPITDESRAPMSTLLDESYKIAITRFDKRIRVGGMAEIVGYDKSLNEKRRKTLEMVVNDLFAGSYSTENMTFWTGLRPKTPDSTPIIGATPIKNLFLNTGH